MPITLVIRPAYFVERILAGTLGILHISYCCRTTKMTTLTLQYPLMHSCYIPFYALQLRLQSLGSAMYPEEVLSSSAFGTVTSGHHLLCCWLCSLGGWSFPFTILIVAGPGEEKLMFFESSPPCWGGLVYSPKSEQEKNGALHS